MMPSIILTPLHQVQIMECTSGIAINKILLLCYYMIGFPRSNSIGRIFQSMTNVADHLPNSEEAIRRGEYAVIRSLIRVLEVLA